jgi:hypothetical protein
VKKCGIKAAGGMIGHAECDLDWGHEGDVHYNGADGFYSRQNDELHHRRQRQRSRGLGAKRPTHATAKEK